MPLELRALQVALRSPAQSTSMRAKARALADLIGDDLIEAVLYSLPVRVTMPVIWHWAPE